MPHTPMAQRFGVQTLVSSLRRLAITAVLLTIAATACSSPYEYSAARIDPPPVVGEVRLPDLADGGQPRTLTANEGNLLLVYFGYTNCPDFCPQSMSDASAARNRLDDHERVQAAMVTIDPERDTDNLADYVTSFFPDGMAFATDDPTLLAQVAQPFGVSYSVTTDEDGEVVVSHTTSLFGVDDAGNLVMTWSYGTPVGDIAADIEHYLDDEVAS